MSRERTDILNAKKVLADVWPGQAQEDSVALLKALHILTRDGALNHDSRRKLKQVLHLVQLLRPSLDALLAENPNAVIADLGAGKSYLGFILYDLVVGPPGPRQHRRRRRAGRAGGTIATARGGKPLHPDEVRRGRDRRHDAARGPRRHGDRASCLRHGDRRRDPVCAASRGEGHRPHSLLPGGGRGLLGSATGRCDQLWRHNIHRREFGAHVTNVIRSLVLEAHGYKVRVTEFTGLEHSLKNELILATRHQKSNPLARRKLEQLVEQLGVKPALLDVVGAA